jgi:hypothetical protein
MTESCGLAVDFVQDEQDVGWFSSRASAEPIRPSLPVITTMGFIPGGPSGEEHRYRYADVFDA